MRDLARICLFLAWLIAMCAAVLAVMASFEHTAAGVILIGFFLPFGLVILMVFLILVYISVSYRDENR